MRSTARLLDRALQEVRHVIAKPDDGWSVLTIVAPRWTFGALTAGRAGGPLRRAGHGGLAKTRLLARRIANPLAPWFARSLARAGLPAGVRFARSARARAFAIAAAP